MESLENLHSRLKQLVETVSWPGEDAGYALPKGSLNFVDACVRGFGMRRVFEFGSGASSRRFLQAGCEVSAMEDSEHWLAETVKAMPEGDRPRFTPFCQPLEKVSVNGYSCLGWKLPPAAIAKLRAAELVLVDSPAYPPFRESALMQALTLSEAKIVILDDVRIPTLRRFCERIASQSKGVRLELVERDHTLAVFLKLPGAEIVNRPGLVERLKGWRRYSQGTRKAG